MRHLKTYEVRSLKNIDKDAPDNIKKIANSLFEIFSFADTTVETIKSPNYGIYLHVYVPIDHIFYQKTKPVFEILSNNRSGWEIYSNREKNNQIFIAFKEISEKLIEELDILSESIKYNI